MPRRNPLSWILAALLVASFAVRADDECTDDTADAAEQALGSVLDQLKSQPGRRGAWEKLLPAIRLYRVCDEEEIAATFSEAVCRQLVDGWKDAHLIASATRRDERLLAFLLGHLDESCGETRLTQLRRNAVKSCPRYGSRFCKALIERIDAQLGDAAGGKAGAQGAQAR